MKPEDLMKLVTTPMPFGKHKGTLIADLPGNYLNWFAREGFPKGEVGQLLRLMQEIDHNGLSDLLRPFANPGRSAASAPTEALAEPAQLSDLKAPTYE